MKKRRSNSLFLPGEMVTMNGLHVSRSHTLWMETGEVDEGSQRGGSISAGQLAVVVATNEHRGYTEVFVLCSTGMGWQVEAGFKKVGAK